ncbi:MAG TPA: MarR family transcriptional regulator [Candidatus Limnocylindrales bacterium]|nr:MarR family transcriptional regulator [Candidatus Limnocylindrales bacterium]
MPTTTSRSARTTTLAASPPLARDGDATEPAVAPLTARDPRLAPWRAFVRAQAHVSRRLDDDLRAEHGLSLQEYVALLILAEAPERRLRMGRLADSLALSKSGATRLIDRLVGDGFVARLSCASDLRGAEAALTEAGVNRLRTAAPTHLRGIADYFLSAIESDDLEIVEKTMRCVADRACGSKAGD